ASVMVSAGMIARPLCARICLPSSTLVPWRRTTRGIARLSLRAAPTMPFAITSHFMMPPKMLTRIAFTFESDVRSRKASVTCCEQSLVGAEVGVVESGDELYELSRHVPFQVEAERQVARLVGLQAHRWIHPHLQDPLRVLLGHRFDLDSAFGTRHHHVPAVRA